MMFVLIWANLWESTLDDWKMYEKKYIIIDHSNVGPQKSEKWIKNDLLKKFREGKPEPLWYQKRMKKAKQQEENDKNKYFFETKIGKEVKK